MIIPVACVLTSNYSYGTKYFYEDAYEDINIGVCTQNSQEKDYSLTLPYII